MRKLCSLHGGTAEDTARMKSFLPAGEAVKQSAEEQREDPDYSSSSSSSSED